MCDSQVEELCNYAEQFTELPYTEQCKMVMLMKQQPAEACRHGMANGMKMVIVGKYRRDLMCKCNYVKSAKLSHRLRDCNGWFNPARHCLCEGGPPYKVRKICRTCNPDAFCEVHKMKQCHHCFPDKFQSYQAYYYTKRVGTDTSLRAMQDAVQTLVNMKQ